MLWGWKECVVVRRLHCLLSLGNGIEEENERGEWMTIGRMVKEFFFFDLSLALHDLLASYEMLISMHQDAVHHHVYT